MVPDGDFTKATIEAVIDASSIETGVADRGAHLKSPDSFDVAQYPEARFIASRFEARGDAGGRLAGNVTTDPLDVDDLIQAAAGHTWDGAPARTTMGHVHLHVGDLDQSAAFYQHGVGFDITVWNYPGALFFSAGGYHHHLGTNVWAPGPAPTADQARLLEWTLVVPSATEARVVGQRLRNTAAPVVETGPDWLVTDPWGTRLRISPER